MMPWEHLRPFFYIFYGRTRHLTLWAVRGRRQRAGEMLHLPKDCKGEKNDALGPGVRETSRTGPLPRIE